MRSKVLLLVAVLACLPSALAGQTTGFTPGWYIVEECAEFSVLSPSATDVQTEGEMFIAPGEVVLAFEGGRGSVLVFESFGRMSAMRPANCLTPAPLTGRPASVTQEIVTMADVSIPAGSTVWMLRYNVPNRTAVVRLAGGVELEVPSESIGLLSNNYAEAVRNAYFQRVHY
jgi:hypothetical protein